MAGNEAATKFFDAVGEGHDALIDAVRAGAERGHRVSTAFIESAAQGQRDTIELARKWVTSPLDFFAFSSSLIEVSTRAQQRALENVRQWFEEMDGARKEGRETLRRLASANRSAGEAAVDVARAVFSRTSEAIRSGSRSMAGAEGDGRRTAREPARAAESSSES